MAKKPTKLCLSCRRKDYTWIPRLKRYVCVACGYGLSAKYPKRKPEPKRKPVVKRKASAAAFKGWETRRRRALEQEQARAKAQRARKARAKEKATKEAKRLAKWRKSYQKYLEFRVPKVEREELEVPEKKELVCRVLFDSDMFEQREEQIWTNFETLLGPSINRILASIPGEEGIVRVMFRLIEGEEFERMQAGTMEDMDDVSSEGYGSLIPLEWDLDTERRLFWSNYYANARTLLPNRPEKKGQDYKASWLGVVRLELCYAPGEAEEE